MQRSGNGWGEEAAGDERAWLRGRLRPGNDGGNGWKWGERSRWRSARTAADGVGADGVGAREWLEMGGEKKPLVMSELGCADGCGWQMGADELRGRLRTAWVQRSGWKWVGRRSRWRSASLAARTAADGKWVGRIARTAADGVGAREWLEIGIGRRSRWRSASLAARTAADGKWVGRIARTAADGVGAREWLEMGGETKPLEISELGCADGCGREMGAENCADGCARRGCNGVPGKGEKGAGDE